MNELSAVEKHSCAACGAQAIWNPAKNSLICGYCGTESPYQLDRETGQVREIDLVQALRDLPEEERGWIAARRTVKCRSCQAVSVFEPERVGQNCDFCGSAELVDYEEIKAPIRPEGLLPFRISEGNARDEFRKWIKGRWFAPNKLKSKSLIDTIHGLYIPYWTFDAQASCPWEAESGYYYYTNETYTDSDGKSKTRRVRHVRWESSSGHLNHFFDDEPVPGSRGVDGSLLREIEPYPTHELVPYDTGFLAGFVVEHYQVVLFDAAQAARESMDRQLKQLCAREIPGDTFRNLQIFPDYSGRTFKLALVPVWLLSYQFGAQKFQVLANGFTGKVAGRYPKSIWKILFLILSIAVIVLLVSWLSSS